MSSIVTLRRNCSIAGPIFSRYVTALERFLVPSSYLNELTFDLQAKDFFCVLFLKASVVITVRTLEP